MRQGLAAGMSRFEKVSTEYDLEMYRYSRYLDH